MKKWFKAGIIGVGMIASQVNATELQLTVDGQEPISTVCYVSCDVPPIPRVPEIPVKFPCDILPDINGDCQLVVLSATKVNLGDVVRRLRMLTGQEVSNGK